MAGKQIRRGFVRSVTDAPVKEELKKKEISQIKIKRTYEIDKDVWIHLKKLSIDLDMTLNQMVTEALIDYIKRKKR